MMLSTHFSLAEFTVTQVRGIDNTPSPKIVEALQETAGHMELIRSYLDHPIIVTSGYRSPEVNRRVGGSSTSAHMRGRACDFICPRFGTPLQVAQAIAKSDIRLGQLIDEGHWVHCSFEGPWRKQLLTAHSGPAGTTYTDGLA